MSEMKFRVVDAEEPASVQEQEQQFQEEFENKQNEEGSQESNEEQHQEEQQKQFDIDDSSVLNYLKERYQKEYNSLDEVVTEKELPEDVKKLMEFGVDNYIKVNKDWEKANETETLREYYRQTKPHLDEEDIDYLLEEEYSFDEDIDDERDIKKKKVALKEELFEARQYLNNLKEQYKVDLGSKSTDVTEDYKKAFSFYQEYESKSKQAEEESLAKAKVFDEKTSRLFSDDFKGFEFNLGDKKQVYKPKDVRETKEVQSDITKVIQQHLDDNGVLKDAHSYHKALAMFRDPDGFAKFFYEQGKADSTKNVIRDIKNIDMNVRDNKEVVTESGTKIRVLSNDNFDGGLRIRKR